MSFVSRFTSARQGRRLTHAFLRLPVAAARRKASLLIAVGREHLLRATLQLPQAIPPQLPSILLHGDFSSGLSSLVKHAFDDISIRSSLPGEIREIEGMSGQKYRSFVNLLLASHPDARYLEIGSFEGSTATAALYGNRVKALCIDNWSQFDGSRARFLANLDKALSPTIDFAFLEQDFRSVRYDELGTFNFYLFDGPHEENDQYDGIILVQPALTDPHVLIVDDWNWRHVRMGTYRALRDAKCRVCASIEVRTSFDDVQPPNAGSRSDWHNGYFISVISKLRHRFQD